MALDDLDDALIAAANAGLVTRRRNLASAEGPSRLSIIHAASGTTAAVTVSSRRLRRSAAQSLWRGSSRSAAETKTPMSQALGSGAFAELLRRELGALVVYVERLGTS